MNKNKHLKLENCHDAKINISLFLYQRNQPDSSNMNEPPKPKPRAKKGKELHYAELDIASNVPMVPPKPSHERVEYAEVQFNKHSDFEHPV